MEANIHSHGYSHGGINLQKLNLSLGARLTQLEANEEPLQAAASSAAIEEHANQRSTGLSIAKDRLPAIVIRVSNEEELTSRSLVGTAGINRSGVQIGLTDAVLDLSQSSIANLLIQSDQALRGLALSVDRTTDLAHHSTNAALQNTLVIGGQATGATWIHANQLVSLAAHSPGKLKVVIDANLAGLDGSHLVDLGGDDVVDLGASQGLTFSDGRIARPIDLSISIDSHGMLDSSVTLGSGNNWISVNSTIGPWQLGIEGLMGQQASNQDWRLAVQARSIAMENSAIDSGAGNDHVTIMAALDPSIRSQVDAFVNNTRAEIELQKIAAINSNLTLGPGDDNLDLEGDVLHCSIDVGTGINQIKFSDGALDTTILMGDGSINQIVLGDQPNAILLKGGRSVTLTGGSASDQIKLDKEATSGHLEGGAGFDSITTSDNHNGDRHLLTLAGPNQAYLNGFSILNFESIQLGPGDDQVKVAPGAGLTGRLVGGAGLDTLDFSTNSSTVTLTIQPGSISEPGIPSMGMIEGFERVLGGQGDDQFFVGTMPHKAPGATGVEIWGGPGRDQFLWDSLKPSWPQGMDPSNGLPSLADLQLTNNPDGGIGLSDQIGWRSMNNADPSLMGGRTQLLRPCTIEGLGDSQLLPIAPIEQLLAGQASLGKQAVNQFAIGTTATGADLLALGPLGEYGVIAHLPGFFSGCCGSTP